MHASWACGLGDTSSQQGVQRSRVPTLRPAAPLALLFTRHVWGTQTCSLTGVDGSVTRRLHAVCLPTTQRPGAGAVNCTRHSPPPPACGRRYVRQHWHHSAHAHIHQTEEKPAIRSGIKLLAPPPPAATPPGGRPVRAGLCLHAALPLHGCCGVLMQNPRRKSS